MRMYETLMILHPEITEERINSLLGRIEGVIEKTGGKITVIDQWGLRKLAYRISKQPRGYYTLMKYAASPTIITELERNLKLLEDCLRFLTIKLDEELDEAAIVAAERVHKKPAAAPPEEAAPEEEPAPELPFDEDVHEEEGAERAEEKTDKIAPAGEKEEGQ